MIQQMYNHEFTESQYLVNKNVADISQEDLKFIEVLKNGAELVGGHYQVSLPFRKNEVNLPNRRSQPEKRFACLEKKLSKNSHLKQDYIKFMNELILKSYARESTSTVEFGKCWDLPHHGVYRLVNEWCTIAFTHTHTLQYLFRCGIVACAKFYMVIARHHFRYCSIVQKLFCFKFELFSFGVIHISLLHTG